MIYMMLAGITCLSVMAVIDTPVEIVQDRKKQYNLTLYSCLMAYVFCILAFRASSIGVDTQNYINKFIQIRSYYSIIDYYKDYTIEPLFFLVNWVLGKFDASGFSLLVVHATIIVICFSKCFTKLSINRYMCLLAFLSLGLFAASLNLLRQTIAVAICAYNLINAIEGKKIKYLFFSMVAIGFHFSAIFFLPAYFICRGVRGKRSNGVKIMAVSIILSTIIEYVQFFASLLFSRWDHYYNIETGAQGYIAFTIFLCITILAFMLQNDILEQCSYAGAILNMNYVHMGIWVLRLFTRNAERISFYYTIAPILLIPMINKAVAKRCGPIMATIFKLAVVVLLLAYFVYKITRDGNCYPYSFWLAK